MNSPPTTDKWDERTSAPEPPLEHTAGVFESFFEGSVDAIWLFDPQAGRFLDCNQAAVELVGAKDKTELLQGRPEDISPPTQPNGSSSRERTAEIIALVDKHKGYLFEWS